MINEIEECLSIIETRGIGSSVQTIGRKANSKGQGNVFVSLVPSFSQRKSHCTGV